MAVDESIVSEEERLPVLLVDDSPTNRRLTGSVLSRVGCLVILAESGEAALDEVERRQSSGDPPFQLVLLDYQLPGMDGAETARRIRDLLHDRTPPMLGLTGHVDLGVFRSCRRAGMRVVLRKPVERRHLETIVARLRALQADI